jgi:hypothetical protein
MNSRPLAAGGREEKESKKIFSFLLVRQQKAFYLCTPQSTQGHRGKLRKQLLKRANREKPLEAY